MKRTSAVIACGLLLLLSTSARAVHYRIVLTVEATDGKQLAHTDPVDRPDSSNTTPTFKVRPGQPLVVQFFLTNVYPHGVRKNVGVHYFIVRQEQVEPATGAPPPGGGNPKEGVDEAAADLADDPDTVLDGLFVVNFKPKDRVGLRQKFQIDKPGQYLVRVQSEHSHSDHEHFSQLILVVK